MRVAREGRGPAGQKTAEAKVQRQDTRNVQENQEGTRWAR